VHFHVLLSPHTTAVIDRVRASRLSPHTTAVIDRVQASRLSPHTTVVIDRVQASRLSPHITAVIDRVRASPIVHTTHWSEVLLTILLRPLFVFLYTFMQLSEIFYFLLVGTYISVVLRHVCCFLSVIVSIQVAHIFCYSVPTPGYYWRAGCVLPCCWFLYSSVPFFAYIFLPFSELSMVGMALDMDE